MAVYVGIILAAAALQPIPPHPRAAQRAAHGHRLASPVMIETPPTSEDVALKLQNLRTEGAKTAAWLQSRASDPPQKAPGVVQPRAAPCAPAPLTRMVGPVIESPAPFGFEWANCVSVAPVGAVAPAPPSAAPVDTASKLQALHTEGAKTAAWLQARASAPPPPRPPTPIVAQPRTGQRAAGPVLQLADSMADLALAPRGFSWADSDNDSVTDAAPAAAATPASAAEEPSAVPVDDTKLQALRTEGAKTAAWLAARASASPPPSPRELRLLAIRAEGEELVGLYHMCT